MKEQRRGRSIAMSDDEVDAFLPALQASGNDTYGPFDKDPKNSARAALTISQPIIAPSAWPLYSQAKHALDAQKAQSIDDRRALATVARPVR